jgi:uncharacterized protein (DUF1015 family)
VAARVAAVPYDVVNTDEARALAEDPLSFLHVSRAEIDLPVGTDPYADAVYAKAVSSFDQLKQEALLQEARPAIYLYRLRMGDHEQLGVAAAYSVDEYRRGSIKKHERTRPDKENDRTRHIIQTRAQSGPVLLTYRQTDALAQAMAVAEGIDCAPLYDFTADDGIQHTIWLTAPEQGAAIVSAFAAVPALYIADGHHRAASAARASEHFASANAPAATPADTPARATGDEHAWFLAVAFPEQQTQILPYHRIVKDLAGRSTEEFLTALRAAFPVARGSAEVHRQGDCAMFLAGQWYTLTLDAKASSSADAIAALDVSRLQDQVLAPLLRIADPRTDKRIDFVGGIRGTGELEQHVNSGRAAVAFALFPTTVGELMTIADAGGIMPPKSTWFEPKLRDGLLTHLI